MSVDIWSDIGSTEGSGGRVGVHSCLFLFAVSEVVLPLLLFCVGHILWHAWRTLVVVCVQGGGGRCSWAEGSLFCIFVSSLGRGNRLVCLSVFGCELV